MTNLQPKDKGAGKSGHFCLWVLVKRFMRLLVVEYRKHDLPNMASSLSYTSLLALVPVFAIVLGVIGLVREGIYTEIFISTLKNQVPAVAGMSNLIDAIREVAGSAKAIVGVGLLMFLGTAFFLFLTIVRDFNRIWSVEKSRSIAARLSGFITAVILVPLLMILSIYVNLYVARMVNTLETAVAHQSVIEFPQGNTTEPPTSVMEREQLPEHTPEDGVTVSDDNESWPTEDPLILSKDRILYDTQNPDKVSREIQGYRSGKTPVKIALRLTSLFLSILAMSALYFLLPNRRVKWWAALSGGIFAGIFLELGNYLFRIYAGMSSTVLMKIYGTLLAVPLGLGWLWILWVIVLLGSVVAYVMQHYQDLYEKAELENRYIDRDLYIALLLMAETAERFNRGDSTSGMVEGISVQTGCSGWLVRGILAKLMKSGVIAAVEGKKDEYLPGRSIESLTLDQIVLPVLGNVFSTPSGIDSYKSRVIKRVLEDAGFALRASLEKTALDEVVLGEGNGLTRPGS